MYFFRLQGVIRNKLHCKSIFFLNLFPALLTVSSYITTITSAINVNTTLVENGRVSFGGRCYYILWPTTQCKFNLFHIHLAE